MICAVAELSSPATSSHDHNQRDAEQCRDSSASARG